MKISSVMWLWCKHSIPLIVGVLIMILNYLYYDPPWPPPSNVELGLSGENYTTREIEVREDYFTRFDRAKCIYQLSNAFIFFGVIWILVRFWASLKHAAPIIIGPLIIFSNYILLDAFYLPVLTPLSMIMEPLRIISELIEYGFLVGLTLIVIGIIWPIIRFWHTWKHAVPFIAGVFILSFNLFLLETPYHMYARARARQLGLAIEMQFSDYVFQFGRALLFLGVIWLLFRLLLKAWRWFNKAQA